MHTESEARKLWCPMVRFTPLINSGIIIPGDRKRTEDGKIDDYCIASSCMMWRWFTDEIEYAVCGQNDPKPEGFYYWDSTKKQWWRYSPNNNPTTGYCGLGGKP